MSSLKLFFICVLMAGALTGLGYFLIKGYGASNFAAGKSEGISLCNVANVEQGNQARQELEKNHGKHKDLGAEDRAAIAISYGILRDNADR